MENGHVRIPNDIMDALIAIRLPGGQAVQLFLFIIRKTIGWNKEKDFITLSQFETATGIKKPAVVRALKKLLVMNLIKIEYSGNKKSYCINLKVNSWNELSKKITHYKKKSTLLPYCYICGFEDATHRHHIIPINTGGLDRVSNIIILCPNCHALTHKGKYTSDYLIILKDKTKKNNKEDNSDLQKSKKGLSKKIPQNHLQPTIGNSSSGPKDTITTDTSSINNKTMACFKKFIEVFPLKVAVKDAELAWNQLFTPDYASKRAVTKYIGPMTEDFFNLIIKAVKDQIEERRWKWEQTIFMAEWKNPASWLRGFRWNDKTEKESTRKTHDTQLDPYIRVEDM